MNDTRQRKPPRAREPGKSRANQEIETPLDAAANLQRWAEVQSLAEAMARANSAAAIATVLPEGEARPLRRLPIDAGALEMAMESNDGMAEWYLDLRTGALLMLSTHDPSMTEEDAVAIADEPDRYVIVDSLTSHDGFEMMRDFVATVSDPRIASALDDALRERKPFRRFKDTAARFGKVYDDWNAFRHAELRRLAVEWLEREGIEAVAPEPRATPPNR